ncbi:energy transducer TonB [Hydrogenimonas thermophila]|uniref:TonB family C-terminal domain-containing protein n=1 Tax=Hydrogenimonas thermophila TaxID=223786 RepID=A0A1I5RWV1_9BACT|nr:energy transducer TonB [Hydrogenimonas thermophila]SFP63015.1 TonB family C-terminal domain-containing protein [Hydrogenimonas thermophila]
MNRRKFLTLLLSLFIHLLLFISLWILLPKEKKELNSSGAKRVQLNLSDFVIPKPEKPNQKAESLKSKTQTKPKPKKVKKKIIQNSKPNIQNLKKTPTIPKKKPTVKEKPKKSVKKIKQKELNKTKPKLLKKPTIKQKPKNEHKTFKETNSTSNIQHQTSKKDALSALAGALGAPAMEEPTPKPPSIDQINNSFSQREFYALYKDEFDHFSPDQKKFIKNNLARIQGITQHYLTVRGYPYFAGRMGQQGTNVVEFYLLPNGDITDLKIITPTGYEQLDQNSLDTIKAAYKDYPRPKEKTKIRFYIHYSIY